MINLKEELHLQTIAHRKTVGDPDNSTTYSYRQKNLKLNNNNLLYFRGRVW